MTLLSRTVIAAATAATLMVGALATTSTTAAAGPIAVSPAVVAAATTDGADVNVVKAGWRHHRRWHRHHRWGYRHWAAPVYYYGPRCRWRVVKKWRWNRWGERVLIKRRIRVCR